MPFLSEGYSYSKEDPPSVMVAALEEDKAEIYLQPEGEGWKEISLDDRLDGDREWGDAGGRGGGCCPVLNCDPCSEEE